MSYTGTKLGQDIRFKDPDKGILSSMKTPKIFTTTVRKQNIIILPIIKLWLNQKIIEFLEFEDETLVNLIINLINSSNEKIDPKNMQYQISGFLGDKTYSFMKKFWKLLISVQECYLQDKSKIPNELILYKIEYDKMKMKEKLERHKEYKEYKEDYEKNNKYEIKYGYEDTTKIELMKVIDSYKKDEKYKHRNKSRSRSRSYEKRKYRSRSREREREREREKEKEKERERRKEKEEYNYKSNSRSRNRKHKRRRDKSSSRSRSTINDRKNLKEKELYDFRKNKNSKRKYSRDDSDSSSSIFNYDDYHLKKHNSEEYYDNHKHKRKRSCSSSDSSETFKI